MKPLDEHESIQESTNLFARMIAIIVLTVLPVLCGYYIDQWLEISIVVYLGIAMGLVVGGIGLWHVQKLAQASLESAKFQSAIKKSKLEQEHSESVNDLDD